MPQLNEQVTLDNGLTGRVIKVGKGEFSGDFTVETPDYRQFHCHMGNRVWREFRRAQPSGLGDRLELSNGLIGAVDHVGTREFSGDRMVKTDCGRRFLVQAGTGLVIREA